ELVLLWAGRHEDRKGLPLALEALRTIPDLDVRLIVAGDGVRRSEWEAVTKQYGLHSKVDFIGTVPHEKMDRLFSSVDAFLFTSLRDSFGSVVLEAMAHELPVITLNHQGVGTFVPDTAGIKVPVTTPEETVRELANAIRHLALFPQERMKAGMAALEFANKQTWERRTSQMEQWYGGILDEWRSRSHPPKEMRMELRIP
ncbi:MAG: glycosyltransferase family 4 protein, partial [Pyrinomonadaceae bacterium]